MRGRDRKASGCGRKTESEGREGGGSRSGVERGGQEPEGETHIQNPKKHGLTFSLASCAREKSNSVVMAATCLSRLDVPSFSL
jgi:hypothetical protein